MFLFLLFLIQNHARKQGWVSQNYRKIYHKTYFKTIITSDLYISFLYLRRRENFALLHN